MGKAAVVLCLALCLYITPYLWSPFASRGQAREAVVVMNMLEQNNYILPLRNGADIPSKPPLFHWLTLPFAFASGELNEFAMRIPSALLAAAGISLIFIVAQYLFGFVGASVTALALATSLEWVRSANLARVDMVFTFFISLAWASFFWAVELHLRDQKQRTYFFLLTGLFAGLSVLSKGPAAVLILGVFCLGYLATLSLQQNIVRNQVWRLISGKVVLLILIPALLISLLWYLPAYMIGGEKFLQVALLRENFGRVVDVAGLDPGHRKPFFYSIIYLFVVFLPWSLFLPFSIASLRQNWRAIPPITQRALLASGIWTLSFILAVTISTSKRTVYLLPIVPSVSLIFAASIINLRPAQWRKYLFSGLAFCCALALLLLGVGIYVDSIRQQLLAAVGSRYVENVSRLPVLLGTSQLAFYGLLSSVFLFCTSAAEFLRQNSPKAMMLLGFGWAMIILTLNYTVMPELEKANSPQRFALKAAQFVPLSAPLYYYQDDFYSVIFYMGRNIPLLTDPAALPIGKEVHVLMRRQAVASFIRLVPTAEVLLESEESAFYGKDKLAIVRVDNERHS